MAIRMSPRVAAALVAATLLAACGTEPAASPAPPAAASVASVAAVASLAATPSASAGPSASPTPSATPAAPAIATGPRTFEGAEIGDVLFAPDGRIVVAQRETSSGRSSIVTLDELGNVLPGWPWTTGDLEDALVGAALGPDGSVYVQARAHATEPPTWRWFLFRLDAAGREMPGFPVQLPDVPFCAIDVAPNGWAYAACEDEDADTGSGTAVVRAIRPDGTTAAGWPVILDGFASIVGFRPDGGAVIATGEGETLVTVLATDGSVVPGWPQRVADAYGFSYGGGAVVDTAGRVRVTEYRWSEGQCGPAERTTYTALGLDGERLPGWPIAVDGWASEPSVGADGSMTIVTDTGRAIRYGLDGRVVDGWPVRGMDISVACYAGSPVVATGDGGVVVSGDRELTLVAADGGVAEGWPVDPAGRLVRACESCTPGPSGPMPPAVDEHRVYAATRRGDQPWIAMFTRDSAPPTASQVAVGRDGDQVEWVRVAPAGRVWTLLTRWSNESDATVSLLVPVGDDRSLAP